MTDAPDPPERLTKKRYTKELERLQDEMVNVQEDVRLNGRRVLVIFEGRDTAGKGGNIKRITLRTNPRQCRVVALPSPTPYEQSQWYFQRYLDHLPAGGEIVLFDRSWYNRAGVEKVMGFCTQDQYDDFLVQCPHLEQMLVHDGIQLVKYWLSVSDEEQRRRFERRISDPAKRWKLSPMDLQSQAHWVDYAEAKDVMFAHTDTDICPWYVVDAENKRNAHLNLLSHLISTIGYKPLTHDQGEVELPPRQQRDYERPPIDSQRWIPRRYEVE